MFQDHNPRKYSVQQNYQIQQNHALTMMFPRNEAFSYQETLSLFKSKYNPQAHSHLLISSCYRCHKTDMVQIYLKIKQKYDPNLKQSNISNFYSNQCFINLYELGKYLKGQKPSYPSIIMGQSPKNLKNILDNVYLEEGFIPHFQRFLLFYPTYLEKYKTLQRQLFQQNLIDPKVAYFLGLIACAQLGSIYGINRMITKFCKAGGNIEWISKKKYPQKIRRIFKLNRKLARSIWEINSDLIQQIVEANYWSQNELALVIQILSFSHSFATVSLALGLNCEQVSNSTIDFGKLVQIKKEYDSIFYESNEGQKLDSVIQNIERISSNSDEQVQKNEKRKQLIDKIQNEKNSNRKQLKKSLRKSDNDEMVQNYMRQIGNQLNKQELYFKIQHVLKPLLPDYHLIQKRTDKDYPPLDASDTNFKYTAFPLLYNLTNKVAQHTLDLINHSQIMTSNNFGKTFIGETKSFRKAIRYYCQNLCGCFHYEYNYRNIPKVATLPLRFYIRLLTLSPIHINNQVLKEIKHVQGQLGLFDLGHVALIVANCKMGLGLTYAMHSFQN